MMSALPSAAAHLGYEQPRLGSGIPYSVPRGTYQCADGGGSRSRRRPSRSRTACSRCSASATTRASRRSRAAPSTATSSTRIVGSGSARVRRPRCWPRSTRPRPRSRPCTRCARCSPIRTCVARDVFVEVDGIVMQGPVARLSRTPARDALGRPPARRRHRRGARRAVTPIRGFVARREPLHGTVRVVEGRRHRLCADGKRVEVHGIDAAIDAPVVLVAHSGGGPQLPALAAGRAGVLGRRVRRRAASAPRPELGPDGARAVRGAASTRRRGRRRSCCRGRNGGATKRMRGLVPDDDLRAAFVAACPAVPVDVASTR